uniref:Envelopment polyprotein n=1 Tax=Mapputta virus TaxID=1590835 RepID=A0A0R7FN09_9VIRU|nr:polyprotein [Mapputta virus]
MFMLLYLLVLANAAPLQNDHCFSGGARIVHETGTVAAGNACLKDDVAQYKIEVVYHNATAGKQRVENSAYIKPFIGNWRECKPLPTAKGNLNILSINRHFQVTTKNYACTGRCDVTIDKEHASIKLHSDNLNYYTLKGTMFKTGWFKNLLEIELENTCENIEITCGTNIMRLHSCFRDHMSCIRYLDKGIITPMISTAVCENLEIIITICIVLITFAILCLLAKTYLCYVMIPVFYPFSVIYSGIYDKFCRWCKVCRLASHPLTACGKVCVCGCVFESTSRLALHRNSGLCSGYKTLRHTRYLCKSKGCNFLFAILLTFLLTTFFTPINAECVELADISAQFVPKATLDNQYNYNLILCIIAMIILILSTFISDVFFYYYIRLFVLECKECNMYHTKIGLKKFGEFTNKCGFCTCGDLEDIEGVKIHKRRPNCVICIKSNTYKALLSLLIILCCIRPIISTRGANIRHFKNCLLESHMSLQCMAEYMDYDCTEGHTVRQVMDALEYMGISKPRLSIGNSNFDTIGNMAGETVFTKKYLSYINRMGNCQYIEKLKKNKNDWIKYAKANAPTFCSNSEIYYCKCLTTTTCAPIKTNMSQYINNTEDSKKIMKVYQKIFPGVSSEFVQTLFKTGNAMALNSLISLAHTKYSGNNQLQAVLFMLRDLEETTKDKQPGKMLKDNHDVYKDLKDVQVGRPVTECTAAELIKCHDRHKNNEFIKYLLCTNKKVYVYFPPDKLMPGAKENTSCRDDSYCHKEFATLTHDDYERFLSMLCVRETSQFASPAIKAYCFPNKIGLCKVGVSKLSAVECEDGNIYRKSDPMIPGLYPGTIAITNNNQILAVNDSACDWVENKLIDLKAQIQNHETLKEFKTAALSRINNDLIIHKFSPTQNMPHFAPTYKAISIQGQETENGIIQSYVQFDIDIISGKAIGLHIAHKNVQLFDMVVFIKSARLEANYKMIYETGPTININLKHEELCTGSCPINPKNESNWLAFTIERTSRWGCEEFGCMAINEGCLYGSCNDAINRKAEVYRQIGDVEVVVDVCLTTSSSTYCKEMRGETLDLSETLEIQLEKNEAFTMPRLVYYEDNRIFHGEINDLGTYAKKCGNVQYFDGKTHGMGNPRIDYTCHAAKRKDVIARRCFDNNYQSCKLLEEIHNSYNHTPEALIISNNRKNLGIAKIKIHMGDLEYKLFNKEPALKFNGHCFGCINCFNNIDCELEIHTDDAALCSVTTECNIMHHRILVTPDKHIYAVKVVCNDNKDALKFEVCGYESTLPLDLTLNQNKLEIDIADQTTYIREKDNRCQTWLCKVIDEGLSFNLFNGIGWYITAIILIIIIIIITLLLIYCIIPCCKNIQSTLKYQEYQMLRENKLK